ncbi:unnamed protein product [Thelazia callipaeda]|uniref:Mitoguardin n=1 Tax=Thelazia callipaeda TaxID=103827 RepID=A0A0N5CZ76_THECL|nr:unnamed protein product [Thelazia callipaeda]
MRLLQFRIPNGYVTFRRTTVVVGFGLGVGVAVVSYFIVKRLWKNRQRKESEEYDDAFEKVPCGLEFPRNENFAMTRDNRSHYTPSVSSYRSSLRNAPASESDLIFSLQLVQEVIQRMEKAVSSLDMVKNRSDKDLKRFDLLSSVLDRLRVLETDVLRIVREGGYKKEISTNEDTFWSTSGSQHTATLSVLSDDSFLSALEEFPVNIDDTDVLMREPLSLSKDSLHFYQEGLNAAKTGDVSCRKIRVEFCCCEDEIDFKAKVWCIRQAFNIILSNEHNRVWLAQAGRQLIADLLRHTPKDPSSFYLAYDAMIAYLSENHHSETIDMELKQRGVREVGFWDVVLDYILIDAFEDLSRAPGAILAVTKNMFLSQSMKESAVVTMIWSVLEGKRARLTVSDGFISHFYDISEAASPTIVLGFLGTDEHLRDLCHYFKEQICSFIVDIFNLRKVRYTCLKDLAEDIRLILETRLEMIQTRLSTELIPP